MLQFTVAGAGVVWERCVRGTLGGRNLYLQFKNRGVDGLGTVAFEAGGDDVEDLLSDGHLLGIVVPRPL